MNKHHFQRPAAICLAVLLILGLVTPALAAEEIAPTCDETYYATLDYYGGLADSSVVKTYHTHGNATLTDYGRYDSVTNLTDGRAAKQEPGKITFDLSGDVPDKFYFEGKTAQPYKDFPWKLSLSYALNGVPVKAETLAGKSGVVEITLTAEPNEKATEYSRNNLVLTAVSMFNGDDILSLEAPGAQVQLLGNLYCVLYAVLPGESQTFTIRVGTEDFSYSGMVLLAVPATLAQLDQVAELRRAEEELGDSYRTIADSMDQILGSLETMNGGLNTAADGLDALNDGRAVISAGKDEVYSSLDTALDAAVPLTEALKPASQHLKNAQSALADATGIVNDMNADVTSLRYTLRSTQQTLDQLKTQISGNGASSVKTITQSLNTHLKTLQGMNSQFQTMGDQLNNPALNTNAAGDLTYNGMTVAQIKNSVAALKEAQAAYQAQPEPVKALVTELQFVSLMSAYTGSEQLQAAFATPAELVTAFAANDPIAVGAEQAAQAQIGPLLAQASDPKFPALLAQMETLQATLKQYNMTLDELKSTAKDYSGIMTMLSPLCEDLTALGDTLAKDGGVLTNTGALSSDAVAALELADNSLKQMEQMNTFINDYEPKAQSALKDAQTLVESAATGMSALVDAARTGETLLKNSGPSLDEGARQTLTGTADALRVASKSLNQTANIRGALKNIDGVVTDEWNRFTGEENNLLLMDPEAAPESITNPKNEGTASIQYIMRTQEIKEDAAQPQAETEQVQADTGTFWTRIKQMFTDLWLTLTGIF